MQFTRLALFIASITTLGAQSALACSCPSDDGSGVGLDTSSSDGSTMTCNYFDSPETPSPEYNCVYTLPAAYLLNCGGGDGSLSCDEVCPGTLDC